MGQVFCRLSVPPVHVVASMFDIKGSKGPCGRSIGQGLFSRVYFAKDTELVFPEEKSTETRLCTYMNDAAFVYPYCFSQDHLTKLFSDYLHKAEDDITHPQKSANNTIPLGNGRFRVLRDISPGEELTKTYGANAWAIYLCALDIWLPKTLSAMGNRANYVWHARELTLFGTRSDVSEQERAAAFLELQAAMASLGYLLTYNPE